MGLSQTSGLFSFIKDVISKHNMSLTQGHRFKKLHTKENFSHSLSIYSTCSSMHGRGARGAGGKTLDAKFVFFSFEQIFNRPRRMYVETLNDVEKKIIQISNFSIEDSNSSHFWEKLNVPNTLYTDAFGLWVGSANELVSVFDDLEARLKNQPFLQIGLLKCLSCP